MYLLLETGCVLFGQLGEGRGLFNQRKTKVLLQKESGKWMLNQNNLSQSHMGIKNTPLFLYGPKVKMQVLDVVSRENWNT